VIHGTVTADYEATIEVLVHGSSGQAHLVQAVIDTGFNGHLTLPPSRISELGLAYHSMALAALADGTRATMRRFEGSVTWDHANREIVVLEAEGQPLLGMAMLRNYRLMLEVVPDGRLTAEALHRKASS
jgi:clan AA aspartic protease